MNKNVETFNAFDAISFSDSLWARWFEQIYPMEPFDKPFLDNVMLFYLDYYNLTLATNVTTRKLFITGMTSEVVKRFNTRKM